MKIIKYIILFVFLQISSVFALCLTDRSNFGDSFSKVQKNFNILDLPQMAPQGVELSILAQDICKNNPALEYATIKYFFFDDKLIEIWGEDFYSDNLKILKWLEKEFGAADDKPKNISDKNNVAHIHWDKSNIFVFYQMEKHDEGTREFFKILSKRFNSEYEDYYKKLDEIN